MYAVIEVGGRQHRVQVGDVLLIDSVRGDDGDPIVFDSVLAVGNGDSLRVGAPTLAGVAVRGTLVGHSRGKKVLTYLFKRTKNSSRRRRGHRQDHSSVRIEAIEG
jgi:large subunit ribosomal protein L21